MKIGIDIRALQTGHKYRGIGEVAKQITSRVLDMASTDGNEIVFYEYDGEDPKKLLNIPTGLKYSVEKQGSAPDQRAYTSMRDKLIYNLDQLYGKPIRNSGLSDTFLQFDYAFGVPKNTRTVLIKHDLIPYVFWSKFFESAWVPFRDKALRTTLRTIFANYRYKRILTRSLKNAGVILSVSSSTKNDLQSLFNIEDSKIKVNHLGVQMQPAKTSQTKSNLVFPTKPYLLFVGAGDARRRVDDLVAAYNNLKAEGKNVQLVLVGENFSKKEEIPNKITRDAVLSSSYQDDILTMGYVSDEDKQELFRQAIAFVYPTEYEGFGIPILESFLLGAPVITYRNSSTPEVGGEHAVYVKNWQGIKEATERLIAEPSGNKLKKLNAAKKYAEAFTWDRTATAVYKELTKD